MNNISNSSVINRNTPNTSAVVTSQPKISIKFVQGTHEQILTRGNEFTRVTHEDVLKEEEKFVLRGVIAGSVTGVCLLAPIAAVVSPFTCVGVLGNAFLGGALSAPILACLSYAGIKIADNTCMPPSSELEAARKDAQGGHQD